MLTTVVSLASSILYMIHSISNTWYKFILDNIERKLITAVESIAIFLVVTRHAYRYICIIRRLLTSDLCPRAAGAALERAAPGGGQQNQHVADAALREPCHLPALHVRPAAAARGTPGGRPRRPLAWPRGHAPHRPRPAQCARAPAIRHLPGEWRASARGIVTQVLAIAITFNWPVVIVYFYS